MPAERLILWLDITGIILAAAGLALVSMIEAALVSVNRIRLHQLAEDGNATARLALRMLDQPQRLLGSQIILINIFVLLAANLTTAAARRYLGADAVIWVSIAVLIALLLVGEIIPKTLSVYFAEGITLRTARLAYLLNQIVAPISAVFNGISFGILRVLTLLHILHGRVHPAPSAFSEEDIKDLVTAGEQSGEVEASERQMIHSVIEFAETAAYEIMLPRTDIVALPIDVTLDDAVDAFIDSGHSRIPVYEENVDNIQGLLYIKDLLIQLNVAQDKPFVFSITELMRPAYFVPETKKSNELLQELQRKHLHMAIVVDEYGGTAGIITIEDLLEEIVGDIIDEYDQEQAEVVIQPDGSALVSGRTSLEKMHDTFNMEMPEDTDAETISGLITEQLGRIPVAGDRIVISGVDLFVLEVTHNRIERLRAVVLPTPDTGAED